MARRKSRPAPLPLFDVYRCPETVNRYPEERVRGATVWGRISRAISETLLDAKNAMGRRLDREEIAQMMGEWLGRSVSKAVLDKYASQSSDDHEITASKLLALMVVTGDHRMLVMMADELGLAVVPRKYKSAVEELDAIDQTEELNHKLTELQSQLDRLRAGRRS